MHQNVTVDWKTAMLSGPGVQNSVRTVGQLSTIFYDRGAVGQLAPDQEVYRVQAYSPDGDGTEGGLYWGRTILQPGKVGDEYFITKGHYHTIRNRAEYYATFQGEGALLLMGEDGGTRLEPMYPGSLHYISGHTAHRVANTGGVPLVFVACWPTDAGHDYATIERNGFSARLLERNGRPVLIPER